MSNVGRVSNTCGMTVFRICAALTFEFAVFVTAGCGGGAAPRNISQAQSQITLTVSPRNATLPVGTTQAFEAFLMGVTPTTAVQWSASVGTIDSSGTYTAPANVPVNGSATVTATSADNPSVRGIANVSITTSAVTLSVSPQNTTLKAGFSQTFTAMVNGTTNTSVTWSVTDLPGDTSFPGSMSGDTYFAPVPVLTTHTYSIVATSNADPSKTAASAVTVIPLANQEQQMFPIKLGTSGGNADVGDCCSGTLGSLLQDQDGKQYILSNNHVIGRMGNAMPGEPIVQPGVIDTGCDFNLPSTVGRFTAAAPISSGADAGIAEVVQGAVDTNGEVIGLGGVASDGSYLSAPPAASTVVATVGMQVAKSGRTTGLACGSVQAIDADVSIAYGAICGNTKQETLAFQGQIITSGISRPGDSGSLIVEAATSRPIALLFAGSKDDRLTIANPIGSVLSALNATTGLQLSFVGGEEHSVSCNAGPTAQLQASREEQGIQASTAVALDEVRRAISVKRQHAEEIMTEPAVIGVGVGASEISGHATIVVFVDSAELPSSRLARTLDGFEVRIVSTGRFTALSQALGPIHARCSASEHPATALP